MAEIAIGPAGAENVQSGSKTFKGTRSLGLSSVIIFTVASINLAYGGTFPFTSAAGVWPGANLFVVITLAAGVGLLFAYLYAAIGACIPHFGADYLVASRVLPPPLAFASSWAMALFYAILGGSIIASIPSRWLPVGLNLLSTLTGREELLSPVAWVSSANGIATLGSLAVVLLFLLMMLPPRITHQVLLAGLVLCLLGWVIIYIQFGVATSADFLTGWDKFYGGGSFMSQLDLGRQTGMIVDYGMERTLMAGLTLGLWITFGQTNVVLFSREVRSPEKNLFRGMSLGLLIFWLVVGLGVLLVQRVIPLEWLAAQSILFQSGGSDANPWLFVYSAVLNPIPLLVGFVIAAWIFSILNMALTLLYSANSALIAWAEDNVIPREVAYIHPALNSPLVALFLICTVAVVAVVKAALQGGLMQNFVPVYMVAFLLIIPTLAIALMPFLRRDIFAQAPGFVRVKIGPLPLITLIGLLGIGYLGWNIWMNSASRVSGGIDLQTLGTIGMLFGSGLLWFFGRMALLHNRKVDISKMFKEVPEE